MITPCFPARCVESNTKFPESAYKSHFKYPADELEPMSKERHRKKSDFTLWADQKIRFGSTMPH
jgi:hypothetical protein